MLRGGFGQAPAITPERAKTCGANGTAAMVRRGRILCQRSLAARARPTSSVVDSQSVAPIEVVMKHGAAPKIGRGASGSVIADRSNSNTLVNLARLVVHGARVEPRLWS